jgi:hypothetical protein
MANTLHSRTRDSYRGHKHGVGLHTRAISGSLASAAQSTGKCIIRACAVTNAGSGGNITGKLVLYGSDGGDGEELQIVASRGTQFSYACPIVAPNGFKFAMESSAETTVGSGYVTWSEE